MISRSYVWAALAVAVAILAALALPTASGDSPDVREAEIYQGSAFAYSPSGDWSDATASGTALDAGLVWADGTLSGIIDVPGSYRAVIGTDGRTVEVAIDVLPSVAINWRNGSSMTADSVVVSGSKAGSIVFPVTVAGPDGTTVTADCGDLFAFDAEQGFVLKDDVKDSAKGTYTLTVTASHESGPLYSESVLTVTVKVVGASEAPGRDAQAIASLGTRTGSVTYVVTSSGTTPVANASYAAPESPSVSGLKVQSDGRDVRVSSSVTDASKLTYNWGDGTRTSLDVQSVLQAAQHTYRDSGSFRVVVTASGPYSDGYAVAMVDSPEEPSESFFDVHGWVFLLFAVLALLAIFGFLYFGDLRMLAVGVVLAALTAITLVLGVGA